MNNASLFRDNDGLAVDLNQRQIDAGNSQNVLQ